MSKRRYNIFHVPILSFFCKSLYADMALRWKGIGLVYLFVLLCVVWSVNAFHIQTQFSKFLNSEELAGVIDQVPPVTVADGEIVADIDQPYYVKAPESGKNLVIIDTTGQITEFPDGDAFLLVTKTKILTRNSPHEIREYDLSTMKGEFSFNREKIREWAALAAKWSGVVVFVVCLPLSLIWRLILTLFYALIGLALAASFKGRITFAGLMRMAVAAMTPVIIARTVFTCIDLTVPYSGMIYPAVVLLLMFMGVKAAVAESEAARLSLSEPGSEGCA